MTGSISYSKKVTLLLSVLFVILFLGYHSEQTIHFQIEKDTIYKQQEDEQQLGVLINRIVESASLRASRNEERLTKETHFISVGTQRQIQMSYLLCIKGLAICYIISLLDRIIIYIQSKDGPKYMIFSNS